jgi:type III secretion protein F
MAAVNGTHINFADVADKMSAAVSNLDGQIRTILDGGADLDTVEMMNLQSKLTEWSLAINMQSTMIKTLGDALRGILQKIN